MLIYLVRWQDLSASLVQAETEEHLLDILDQVGNPDDCEWSIYEGPLFIDFRLPVEWSLKDGRRATPVTPEQVVIGNVALFRRLRREPAARRATFSQRS